MSIVARSRLILADWGVFDDHLLVECRTGAKSAILGYKSVLFSKNDFLYVYRSWSRHQCGISAPDPIRSRELNCQAHCDKQRKALMRFYGLFNTNLSCWTHNLPSNILGVNNNNVTI